MPVAAAPAAVPELGTTTIPHRQTADMTARVPRWCRVRMARIQQSPGRHPSEEPGTSAGEPGISHQDVGRGDTSTPHGQSRKSDGSSAREPASPADQATHGAADHSSREASTTHSAVARTPAGEDAAPEQERPGHRSLRYALAASGILAAGIGSWALVGLSGRPRALLSALIVVGVVLALSSVLRFEPKRITIELILAVLGVLTLPYAIATEGASAAHLPGNCADSAFAHRKVLPRWEPYSTDPSAFFSDHGGVHGLYFPNLRWAGYFIPLPSGLCDYTVSFFAREIGPGATPSVGAGWGYGLGICDTVNAALPSGFSLQYAFYQLSQRRIIGSLEAVDLPRANTFPNGVAQGSPYPLDYGEHEWTLVVAHGQVQVILDDDYKVDQATLTGSGLPRNCRSSGVFLRVWGGTAQFRDLVVTPGS